MPDFFNTVGGQQAVYQLLKQLTRIADALEQLATKEKKTEAEEELSPAATSFPYSSWDSSGNESFEFPSS